MGKYVPSPSHCRGAVICTGEQQMKIEYGKEEFIWKRVDCKGPMVNHLD